MLEVMLYIKMETKFHLVRVHLCIFGITVFNGVCYVHKSIVFHWKFIQFLLNSH